MTSPTINARRKLANAVTAPIVPTASRTLNGFATAFATSAPAYSWRL